MKSLLTTLCLFCVLITSAQDVSMYYDSLKSLQKRLSELHASGLYRLPESDMQVYFKDDEKSVRKISFLPNEIKILYGRRLLLRKKSMLIVFSRDGIRDKSTYLVTRTGESKRAKTSEKDIARVLQKTYKELLRFTEDAERHPDIPPGEKKYHSTEGHG